MKSLGILQSELFELTQEEFEESHPDVKSLPDDIKKLRFDALEKYRQESIQLAIDQREKIINDEIKII